MGNGYEKRCTISHQQGNARSKRQWLTITSHLSKRSSSKRQGTTGSGKRCHKKKKGTILLLMGIQISSTVWKKTIWWFLKKLNGSTIQSSNSTTEYMHPKEMKTVFLRNIYTHTYCSFIRNTQDTETT